MLNNEPLDTDGIFFPDFRNEKANKDKILPNSRIQVKHKSEYNPKPNIYKDPLDDWKADRSYRKIHNNTEFDTNIKKDANADSLRVPKTCSSFISLKAHLVAQKAGGHVSTHVLPSIMKTPVPMS